MFARRRLQNSGCRSPRQFRPRVEALEGRLPLAGNVVAIQEGGNLFLTGDDLANQLWIVGSGVGEFEVHATATELNGQYGAAISYHGVTNLSLNMRGGDDIVSFIQTNLPGALTFRGGDGNDQLSFGPGSHGDHTLGRLYASLGAGNDTLSAFRENSFTVRQSFVVDGGQGNNFIDLQTDTSVVLGDVRVYGGNGADQLLLTKGAITTQSIVMIAGNGRNVLQLLGDATVNGHILQVGNDGQDDFVVGLYSEKLTTISGAVVLYQGNGDKERHANNFPS